MSTAYVGLQRKPAASAQPIDKRRVGKRDRELILRFFKAAPVDIEPSAFVYERMERRYSEAVIDSVVRDQLDLHERIISACTAHANGFHSFIREVRVDTEQDWQEAV